MLIIKFLKMIMGLAVSVTPTVTNSWCPVKMAQVIMTQVIMAQMAK